MSYRKEVLREDRKETATYIVSHLVRKIGMLQIRLPVQREDLGLPPGGNRLVVDLEPPLGLVGDVLDELEHAGLADEERGGLPAFVVPTEEEGEVLLGEVVDGEAEAGEGLEAALFCELVLDES